jgi:hypothetical protein
LQKEKEFFDMLVRMHADLRDRPKDEDPGWSTSPPSPFPATIFPIFHEDPDPKNHHGMLRVQMFLAGRYMGI